MICICRTSESETRHGGMSVLVADLAAEGVDVRPIRILNGAAVVIEELIDAGVNARRGAFV